MSKKIARKSARTNKSTAKRPTDAPVPYRPTGKPTPFAQLAGAVLGLPATASNDEVILAIGALAKGKAPVEREPLPPLTGPIGPLPRAAWLQGGGSSDDLEAERVALRQTPATGARWALSDTLFQGLATGGETPLDMATAALHDIADELAVLGEALETTHPHGSITAHAVGRRANMVAELCERIERARSAPEAVAPPPAHEVAAALVTLPGVLGAASTWDRLMRIAERLNVAVVTEETAREWMQKLMAPTDRYGSEAEHRQFLRDAFTYRPASAGERASVAVWPFEADREMVLAERLARAVAKREGYGRVTDTWCDELAAVLLDRRAEQGAA